LGFQVWYGDANGEYIIGNKHTAKCPSGYYLVADENECKGEAASGVGKTWKRRCGQCQFQAIGCFYDTHNIWFNPKAGSFTKTWFAPVCKKHLPLAGWRSDGKCGPDNHLNGVAAICDPNGNGRHKGPCCSNVGWCGNTDPYCKCDGCKSTLKRNHGLRQMDGVWTVREMSQKLNGYGNLVKTHVELVVGEKKPQHAVGTRVIGAISSEHLLTKELDQGVITTSIRAGLPQHLKCVQNERDIK